MNGKTQRNVFIATLPRSGSTLLGMILGANSTICHIGESAYWAILNPENVTCSCGNTACPILMEVYHKVTGHPEIKSIYHAYSLIDLMEEPLKMRHELSLPNKTTRSEDLASRQLDLELKGACLGLEFLAEVFRNISGRQVTVDNTKAIRIGERLQERDGWKILLLTCDPRGLASSNKLAGVRKNVSRPVSSKIPVYIGFAQKALRLLDSRGLVSLLRYEDLCADPFGAIRNTCNFLEVPYEESMLQFKEDRGHILKGNRMIFDGRNTISEDIIWIKILTSDEIFSITKNQKLISLYKELGYRLTN